MPVLAGTSGWQYRDWRETLYPPGLAQRRWLEYYAGHYSTVENNGTFYRLPGRETFADWRARTPDGFVMAVKASRYLTHIRRLRDPAEPVGRLLRAAAGLTGRRVRVAVEFRHPSWWTDEIRQLLERHQAALCWADRLGHPVTPLWQTADWGYLRFHEGTARPWPRYDEGVLRSWVQRTAETWPGDADLFAYFNNDQGGAAPHDAAAFASIARQAGLRVAPADVPGTDGRRDRSAR